MEALLSRDVLIVGLVVWGCVVALRHPWVGVMLWTWLSLMNPHRYTWGFAYDAPLAAASAACTLIGFAITKDRRNSPFKGAPVMWFALFTVWMTVSWLMGLHPSGDYGQWDKVMKINFMVLVGLALLHNKLHIVALGWVTVLSLGLLGAKGGVFTLSSGGVHRVWGPAGSFIQDNNEFALALVMTIPLIWWLRSIAESKWVKRGLLLMALLCAASAFGSHSRGGFLAIAAMALMLWWRAEHKVRNGLLLGITGVALLAFMPGEWSERMSTIDNYSQDASALGRISAWWTAWNLAFDYPFGIGFTLARPELFAKYSPYPDIVHAAHSIYFLVLGNHGFVGLFLFLMIGVTTLSSAMWLRRHARHIPQARWAYQLGSMAQVSMVGYAVGGAFLSLSYFDLPYIIMSLVVLARVWVQTEAWKREPVHPLSWRMLPGLAGMPGESPTPPPCVVPPVSQPRTRSVAEHSRRTRVER